MFVASETQYELYNSVAQGSNWQSWDKPSSDIFWRTLFQFLLRQHCTIHHLLNPSTTIYGMYSANATAPWHKVAMIWSPKAQRLKTHAKGILFWLTRHGTITSYQWFCAVGRPEVHDVAPISSSPIFIACSPFRSLFVGGFQAKQPPLLRVVEFGSSVDQSCVSLIHMAVSDSSPDISWTYIDICNIYVIFIYTLWLWQT